MKAVIFSCSVREGKYSTTYAWSKLMQDRFKRAGVDSSIINLRDYDYEAAPTGDELHEKLTAVYDADFIIFTSPINFGHPTFTCKNLIDRFVHANNKARENSIDIFKDKIWEYVTFGAHVEWVIEGKPVMRLYDKSVPQWPNNHGYLRRELSFMDHLDMDDLSLGTMHPDDMEAPAYDNMHESKEAIKMCDRICEKFVNKHSGSKLPSCSIEKFLEMFESNDQNAFGRGFTLADDNLSVENVQGNIEYIKKNVVNTSHKLLAICCMKERCVRMQRNDLAKLYYVEQFKLLRYTKDWIGTYGTKTYHKGHCTGNYAPVGY